MAVRRGRDGADRRARHRRRGGARALRSVARRRRLRPHGPGALSHARQVAVIGEVLGRCLTFHALSPDDFRRETAGSWPPSAVEMLLAAWGAAVGHPAYVTTTVADLTGTSARSFRDWVAEHAD